MNMDSPQRGKEHFAFIDTGEDLLTDPPGTRGESIILEDYGFAVRTPHPEHPQTGETNFLTSSNGWNQLLLRKVSDARSDDHTMQDCKNKKY